MSAELATRLIDVLGALLLFTMILILAAGQLYRAIYAVAAQAVFLGIAGAVLARGHRQRGPVGHRRHHHRGQGDRSCPGCSSGW